MKYFKHKGDGLIYAFNSDGSQDHLITPHMDNIEFDLPVAGCGDEITTERLWRDAELTRSDIEIFKVQDSDPKSKGAVAQWREYRKALRAWPALGEFPDKTKRPAAPDVI